MTPAGVDFLQRIADDRRRRIEESKLRVPAHVLRARLGAIQPAGRLERALRRGGSGAPIKLLCEMKRASPSRGMLNADVDPVATARLYQDGGATAVSLVTEPDHFQGDAEWVNARARGGDAAHSDEGLRLRLLAAARRRGSRRRRGACCSPPCSRRCSTQRLITEARLIGLDTLVEVHDAGELHAIDRARAPRWSGSTTATCARFAVDLETSIELLPRVPPLVTAVAESGLAHRPTSSGCAPPAATRC